jgi:hypothetical protein
VVNICLCEQLLTERYNPGNTYLWHYLQRLSTGNLSMTEKPGDLMLTLRNFLYAVKKFSKSDNEGEIITKK